MVKETDMITIVIPTKNRSNFLTRQLLYYSKLDFKGCFCIGDSSNAEHLERSKKLIRALNGKLNIIHREYPESIVHHCVQQLVKLVNTPYAAYVSDDDFLVPSGLEKCRLFLEQHPEYSAAHGVAVKIYTRDSRPHGQIILCKRKPQPVEEAESASERFLHYISHLSDVCYSVHRVESLLTMYESVHLFPDGRFSNVLLPNCLSIINGKIKELGSLSLVRHMQDEPTRTREEIDTFFWITSEKWLSYYHNFRDILAKELMRQDGITLEEAQQVVKQGFSIFLSKSLKRECRKYYPEYNDALSDVRGSHNDKFENLRSLAGRMPGARRSWRWMYRLNSLLRKRLVERDERSLPALLDPSSPYHADFMPIYRAVTTPPEGVE